MRVIFQAESDEYRRRVLAERFPGVAFTSERGHSTDLTGGIPTSEKLEHG